MNLKQRNHRGFRRALLPIAVGYVVIQGAGLSAQNSTPNDEEIVELSPFVVTTDKDVGYLGGNTTAGSRLNTDLKDTSAAITVFTSEFLSDLGATSLEDLVGYGANLEKEVNQYSPSPDTFFFGGADRRETTVRVRGLAASTAADYFETGIKIDLYNVERIEQASGPNSILFGLGSPGGLINTSTKRANVGRDRTSVRFQAGTDDYYRFELDHNQVLLQDKLAFRLNGLYQRSDSWRKYNVDDSDRIAASLQWKLSEKTAFVVGYEDGEMTSTVDRMYNGFNSFELFETSGAAPKSDAQYNAAQDRPLGINRQTANANSVRTIYATDADGSAPFAFHTANATGRRILESTYDNLNTPITTPRSGATLLTESELPFDINIFGSQSHRDAKFSRLTTMLEHRLTKDIALELAYNRERFTQDVQVPGSGTTALFLDPNSVIPNPDGSATPIVNPNAGDFYIESQWGGDRGGFENDVIRGSISWTLDMERLGRHNIAGMFEYGVKEEYRSAGSEIIVDENNVPINNIVAPGNNNNKLWRRQYINLGDYESYVATGPDDVINFTHNGKTYHSRMEYFRGVSDVERVTKSGMLVTQSRFFSNRLVFAGGLRKDDLTFNTFNNTNAYTANDPEVIAGRALVNSTYFTRDIIATNETAPTTRTLGSVYHINDTVSVFYNHANNVGQPAFNIRVLPDLGPAPATQGVTDDAGFMLNLLEGKLYLRATAYETALVDGSPQIFNSVITNVNKAILDGLLNAGRISQDQYNQREFGQQGTLNVAGLSDSVTKGVDLAVNYNPNNNLTLQLNVSYSKTSRSNVAPEIEPWFDEAKAFWYSTPGAGALASGNTTLGNTIDDNVSRMLGNIATYRDGIVFNYGDRPYKVNASTRYSFREGSLKGAFVGGGVRWQSKSLIGQEILSQNTLGVPTYGDKYYGPKSFNVDAFVGYKRKVTVMDKKSDLTLQLNVTNLTDEPSVHVLRYNGIATGHSKVVVTSPLAAKLSASLTF